jgi:hypothetical protein
MKDLSSSETPRIFRVTITRHDGRRRYRFVKCPYWQRDPGASLLGLQAKLAELTLGGHILGHSTLLPAAIPPKVRPRMTRWPEALGEMLS